MLALKKMISLQILMLPHKVNGGIKMNELRTDELMISQEFFRLKSVTSMEIPGTLDSAVGSHEGGAEIRELFIIQRELDKPGEGEGSKIILMELLEDLARKQHSRHTRWLYPKYPN